MGFNACAGFGLFLTLAAVVLLVFGEISQINSTAIPRRLCIVSISTAGLGQAIAAATGGGVNASAIYAGKREYEQRVGEEGRTQGLQMTYEWGLWGYCATTEGVGGARSYCTKPEFGFRFQPALALTQDIPTAFAAQLNSTLPSSTFTQDDYLGRFTSVANYLVFVGAILSVLALFIGVVARRWAYLFGALFAFLAALCLAVGMVIYTVIFARTISAVNGTRVEGVPLGIIVSYGYSLWIVWAATGAMVLAVVPFTVACCTGRKVRREEKEQDAKY